MKYTEGRFFIAITVNQDIRNEALNLQYELKKNDIKASWVKPENMHITLRFLGDLKEKQIEKMLDIAQKISENHQNFEVTSGYRLRRRLAGFYAQVLFPGPLAVGLPEHPF